MICYYTILFVITVISLMVIIFQYENRKTNYYYTVLIMLMTVGNAGYLTVAVSTGLEEAILANKILYVAGCFVPVCTLSFICTLTNYRLPAWSKGIMYGFSGFVYGLVMTIGYSDIYYSDVYIKKYKDATVIGHVYGVAHPLFYVMLFGYTAIQIVLILHTVVKRKSVSVKNLVGIGIILIIDVYLFVMGKVINPAFEIMPLIYAIDCIILLYMFRRGIMYNFEDNIDNLQKKDEHGYIMFDEKLNYLGCNYVAGLIFQQLKESTIDKQLENGHDSKIILSWIERYSRGEEQKFGYEHGDVYYECGVKKLFHKGRHRGYVIKLRDRTDEWKYLKIVSKHNEELEAEVSKQRRISMELEEAKTAAESASETKSQFLARMSHEIRTPINAVMGMNEMILRESGETETKKYAYDIKMAANSLLGLINEILDSSKIQAGMMEIIPVSYESSTLFNDLYHMVEVKAADKGLELIYDIDKTIPCEMYGDDMRLKQVIVNLLSNAVKYTKTGTVTFKATWELVGTEALLYFSVKDTGIGIKKEDFDKLFEKFERIEESRNRNIEGTGLGLNIASCLLVLMGSSLKVKSEYGKGSEFYFAIRQKIVDIEPIGDFRARVKQAADSEQFEVAYTASKARVLIVDDNEMNRKVFKGMLKETKVSITEADCGESCISILEKEEFHIVFLDHMMPGLDGVETFRIIKNRKLCENTPVIMFTANVMTGEREKYLSEGFADFLSKPIIPKQLDEIIVTYLPKELVIEEKVLRDGIEENINKSIPVLEEFDFDYAMRILKNEEFLLESLRCFKEMLKYLPEKLSRYVDDIYDNETLKLYRIEVHALKSTSLTVGALLLSKLARILEVAAIDGEFEKIIVLNPVLTEEIEKHLDRVNTLFFEEKLQEFDSEIFVSYLEMLDMALQQEDYDTGDFVMGEIKKYICPDELQRFVDTLSGQVMNMETYNAIGTINNIKGIIGGV